jgi:hypothetical protein
LQTRRDIHTITKQITTAHHYVANVDTDAEVDALVW